MISFSAPSSRGQEISSEEVSSGPLVPLGLIDQIEELLDERPELGYIDVDEFVRNAIRRFIEYHKV